MHILHFCGALKGGPLSAIAEWTHQQVAAGHTVSLVYSPLRDRVEEFRDDLPEQVALYPLPVGREIRPSQDLRAVRGLLEILRQTRPDILHLHSSKAGAVGRIAGRLARIPTVYSTHGMAYLRTDVGLLTRAVFYGMEWVLGPIGNVTVACSPSELQTMWAIPGRKMAIPNGVDISAFPERDIPAVHDGLDIVLSGRITAQKNPLLACRIAARSPANWQWTWLGGGELEEALRKQGRIAVSGWTSRAQAMARLRLADVMVHTSSWEGMPIAILEAMAAGLPVVATNVVGNRDLIVPGETGFVASDVASFLEALHKLAAAPDLRRRMGEAGRRRIAQNFEQSLLAARWLDLYTCLATR
jgi:glycosyltransferase involved in cell wall biosynthesis